MMSENGKLGREKVCISTDGMKFNPILDVANREDEIRITALEGSAAHLRCHNININYRSIVNPSWGSEYLWFKVSDRKDLEILCSGYRHYCLAFRDICAIESHITYPDYVGIVLYTDGEEDSSFVTISELKRSAIQFFQQFSKKDSDYD